VSNETDQPTTPDPEPCRVRLLGSGPTEAAESLASRGFTVVGGPRPAGGVDCLVVDADTAEDDDATSATSADGTVPVILYAASPDVATDRAGVAGYARRGDVEALCDQIRWHVGRRDRDRDCRDEATTAETPTDDRTTAHDRTGTTADDRLGTLHRGTVSLIEVETEAELFERTVDIASRLLDFDSCYIAVAEDDRLVKRAGVGDVTDEALPIDHGIVGQTYRTGTTYLVRDTAAEPRADPVRPTHRSGIAVALGGEGVFVVIADEPNAFTGRDRDLAELLVRYAEGTLARIRSAAAIAERHDLVESLHEGTAALAAVQTTSDAAEVSVELAERILSFDTCYVSVREGDTIVPYAVSSGAPPDAVRPMDVSEGLAGETIRTGESRLLERVEGSNAAPSRPEYRSGISVPLGEYGVFQAVSEEEGAFDADDLELAELLAGHVTETFSRLRAEADLGDQRERVARLHAHTVRLVRCHDVAALYEESVETARTVLGFDTAYVLVVEGDRFVPTAQATHADHEPVGPLPLDHGVASETYRTGESFLVRDFEANDRAEPTQSVSGGGISVPLGDDAVFQAVSRDADAFDEFDLELAELLASYVTATRERLRAETELREERDRLGALFENVPDAAVSYELVDDDPYVRAVNPAFERVFGFAEAELVGENLDEYIVPLDDETERNAAALNARLKRGESIRTECRRRTTDGVRAFILQVVPLELGRENVAGFAIYTDITARRERERELRRQNERLEEFANIVSHDLRNPLSIASGYLELAAESGDPEAFDRVAESLDRMDRLVEDLLALARKGQVVGETTALDLVTVAKQAWAGVETADATLDLSESLPAEGDESRLLALFENLFRNSVEHGGTDVTVRVEALEYDDCGDDDSVGGFAVEDDGPGIAPDERTAVLAAGETTSDDGIGYGLAIVKGVVEAHGWSLSVTEGRDGGARFEICF
jgi:PAS domain S-box-containing protein